MTDIDRNSPDYLAGRADMANELVAEAEKAESKRLTMDEIKRMSTSEINSRWSEVQAVLGGQR